MNKGILLFLLLSSTFTYAEKIKINGGVYTIQEKNENLTCNKFEITSVEKSLPFSVDAERLPEGITMGHLGNENLLSQIITFKTKKVSKVLPELANLLSSYERIDSSRPYISKPISCVNDKSVLFYMWGGGNCSNVCEAYALITFKENGVISDAKGLTYEEYKHLQNN